MDRLVETVDREGNTRWDELRKHCAEFPVIPEKERFFPWLQASKGQSQPKGGWSWGEKAKAFRLRWNYFLTYVHQAQYLCKKP